MKTAMKTTMKSLIPLLVVASAVAAVDVQKRIINGYDCPDTEGTHYVVLKNGNDEFCGGNLISDEWILTAEHCDKPDFDVILGHHPSLAGTEMHITATSVKHYFPDDTVAKEDRHDIMLVKLPQKTTLPTITLPPTSCTSPTPPFSNPYTIMGWSFTDLAHKIKPAKLQCGNVPLFADCTGLSGTRKVVYTVTVPADRKWNNNHMLCSKSLMMCQGCPGDSGGSLVKGGVLVGVTLGVHANDGQTYFADVCAYIDWIRTTASIK